MMLMKPEIILVEDATKLKSEALVMTVSVYLFSTYPPPYLPLATSEMRCWSGGRGIFKKKLSLCYSIVYCYNGAQRYEQFLQVG